MRLAFAALLVACGGTSRAVPPAAPPAAPSCAVPTTPGTSTIACDGIRYEVTVPEACARGSTKSGCGLVLDVHGLTMSAQIEDANTHMRALGLKHGYVVVQPSANPAPMDRTNGLPPTWPVWIAARDDERVFSFLTRAIEELRVDRARVHMTGFSLGAMMTWRFLCAHAEVFASVAPASGVAGCDFARARPSREVPVLYLHGRRDPLVPFYAAKDRRAAMVRAWSLRELERAALDDHATRTRYVSAQGTEVVFVEHDYRSKLRVELGGHCFPGSDDRGDAPGQLYPFGCEPPNAFAWGELAMEFFRAHPRS